VGVAEGDADGYDFRLRRKLMEDTRLDLLQGVIRIFGKLKGTTPEERQQALLEGLERERAKYIDKDASAVAYYDRLIARMKERGHVCEFPADNDFNCPVCGESL
jgi:hypothetical protein